MLTNCIVDPRLVEIILALMKSLSESAIASHFEYTEFFAFEKQISPVAVDSLLKATGFEVFLRPSILASGKDRLDFAKNLYGFALSLGTEDTLKIFLEKQELSTTLSFKRPEEIQDPDERAHKFYFDYNFTYAKKTLGESLRVKLEEDYRQLIRHFVPLTATIILKGFELFMSEDFDLFVAVDLLTNYKFEFSIDIGGLL